MLPKTVQHEQQIQDPEMRLQPICEKSDLQAISTSFNQILAPSETRELATILEDLSWTFTHYYTLKFTKLYTTFFPFLATLTYLTYPEERCCCSPYYRPRAFTRCTIRKAYARDVEYGTSFVMASGLLIAGAVLFLFLLTTLFVSCRYERRNLPAGTRFTDESKLGIALAALFCSSVAVGIWLSGYWNFRDFMVSGVWYVCFHVARKAYGRVREQIRPAQISV